MTDSLHEYSELLASGFNLDTDQIAKIAGLLINDRVDEESKCTFLKNFSSKGETKEEFAGFVSEFRKLAKNPQLEEHAQRAIDLCGTGGDRSGSFNISTFVSLVVASAGIPVIKHGNRSISSNCGSADLLEALGIPMETEPEKLNASLSELNFCFLFAPHFHPAFKSLAPVRRKLAEEGIITMFNRLGPCLNPATPAHQILGVYDPAYLEQMAHALLANGSKSGWVVHGTVGESSSDRMDELTACGPNLIRPYGTENDAEMTLEPSHWGIKRYPTRDLAGGTLRQNLSILQSLLRGDSPAGLRATISINVSSALWIAGDVESIEAGMQRAEELLADGSVFRWLNKAREFFAK
ncbi:MAG: anthranilate phosphoribosyltransferase [Opitutae bacterium]